MNLTSDCDIFITASSLISHHGTDAQAHAVAQHQAMLDRRDREGMQLWNRIRRAVRVLLAEEPGDGEGVH